MSEGAGFFLAVAVGLIFLSGEPSIAEAIAHWIMEDASK